MPPNPVSPAVPPPRRIHQASRPPSSKAGPNHSSRSAHSGVPWLGGLAVTVTPFACRRWKSWSLAYVGRSVVNAITWWAFFPAG
jgi:hypothetical protein